jgi:tripartite-type tricarboxylate transporter receptor subunit TctC
VKMSRWFMVALALFLSSVGAQPSYPERPIRFIVPFPTGNPTDTVARHLTEKMGEILGQPFIVENRPGAGGAVGSKLLADSKPDGYTFGLTANGTHSAAGTLFAKLPYDPLEDFVHVARYAAIPWALAVGKDFPASNLDEFISHARANPRALTAPYYSGSTRLAVQLLRALGGIESVDVPYTSPSQVLVDLRNGQLQFALLSPEIAATQQNGGYIRVLAVTSAERLEIFPGVPTLGESVQGYEFLSWLGIAAPAGTSPEAIERVRRALLEVMGRDETRQRLAFFNITPLADEREDVTGIIRTELATWDKIARQVGLQTVR